MPSLTRRLPFAAALLAAVAALATSRPTAAVEPTDAPQKYPADPVRQRIWQDVWYLASETCEGRGVETEGINKAADYIAESFKKAGLKPGGLNGSYFQPFTLTTDGKLGTPVGLSISGPKGDPRELKHRTDFAVLGHSPQSKASGGLVFAGYGITAPELKYDDYAGLDVAGKIVIVIKTTPRADAEGEKRFDPLARSGSQSIYAPVAVKIQNAAAHKAAGVIVVNDPATASVKDVLSEYRSDLRGIDKAPFPVMQVKRDVVSALLKDVKGKTLDEIEAAIDRDLKPASFELTGWTASAEVTATRTEVQVKNVIGYLEGSGPRKDETVVIGGHYDHLGFGEPGSLAKKDVIKNIHHGADDNASGTTGVLELARRYAAMKNREGRRLMFMAFSAEERGLLGSLYYCQHPRFPIRSTVAMLNMDMIGRTKPVPADWLGLFGMKDRLMIYGTGSAETFPRLVDETTSRHDFKIFTQASGYGPSDHASFYRHRIPVLFFYTGTHGEYHRPTDVADKINVDGLKKVIDLVEEFANELRTASARPKYQQTTGLWNDPSAARSGGYGARLGTQPAYQYEGDGVLLDDVTPGGPAEAAGLRGGDVIMEMGGKPVKDVYAYHSQFRDLKPGQPIEMVVVRRGKRMTFKVTPE